MATTPGSALSGPYAYSFSSTIADTSSGRVDFTTQDWLWDFGPTGAIPFTPPNLYINDWSASSLYGIIILSIFFGGGDWALTDIFWWFIKANPDSGPPYTFISGPNDTPTTHALNSGGAITWNPPTWFNGSYNIPVNATKSINPGSQAGATSADYVNADQNIGYVVQAYTGESSNIVTNKTLYGIPVTRTNIYVPAGAGNSGENIFGPYNFYYSTPGTYTPRLEILWRKDNSGSGYTSFIKPGLNTGDNVKTFPSITIFQHAVAVTSVTGVGTFTGNPYSSTVVSHTFSAAVGFNYTFNKSTNRGDAVSSNWIIEKNVSSTWVTASVGVDYNITGTLTTDVIVLDFLLVGNYRITNNVSGTTSGSAGTNTNQVYSYVNTFVAIPITVTNTVTLPIVSAVVTPVVAFGNSIVNLSPLEGITMFTISVDAALDITSASFSEFAQYGGSPPDTTTVKTLTAPEWEAWINGNCTVHCNIYDINNSNIIVQQAIGLGVHVFTLPTGDYQVGYNII
jgi:hypothetical protein